MPRYIQGPDGKIHEMPDEATDAQISAALGAVPATNAKAAPKAKTWTDVAVDLLPMAGGAAGGILGGIGGTAFGMGVGGVPGAVGGAAVGGAAGEAAKQLINRARGAAAPTSVGQAATDIAESGAVQGVMELGGQMVPRILKGGAEAVYRGYLKPSLAKASIGKAQEIVETALEEGIPITSGGVARARATIAELKAEVNRILKASGDTVDLTDLANKVRQYAQKTYNKAGVAPEEFEAAMKVADRIDQHPTVLQNPFNPQQPLTATMERANEVKEALQAGKGRSASYGTPSPAMRDTEKMAAREARLDIESKVPAVGPRNARASKLIDAAKAISRAVEREANQSMSHGVKTLVAGAIGGEEYRRTGNPYEAIAKGLVVRGMLTPEVATRAAIVAARLAKINPMAPPQAMRIAVAALEGTQNEQ